MILSLLKPLFSLSSSISNFQFNSFIHSPISLQSQPHNFNFFLSQDYYSVILKLIHLVLTKQRLQNHLYSNFHIALYQFV
ncbi:hypothetical protein P8452_18130 [Trifolium repens]|nr:hypothetical protein P8452_18130 [Trifolium repens]